MIDTIPANVVLISVITPYDVKPYNLQLNVVGDDDLQFSGAIRFKTTSIPKSVITSIQLAYKDRNGADGGVIGTTILGDASDFDDIFTFFDFNATIPAKTSISSFTVVAALSSGTVTYNNSQEGFPVQDTVFAQTLNSNLAAPDAKGNQAATLVAAVRKGTTGDVELTFSSVQKMTYNNLPTISKSTISMARAFESNYYTFYSTTYSIATAAVNGIKYNVSVGEYSDSFKSLKLPVASNALSCQGGGNSWSNTTSSTSTTSSVPTLSTGDADMWTTTVVTALTTYCPSATEVVQGSRTYTVTQATTLIITDCPCTVSWSSSQATTSSSADSFATTISNLVHAGEAAPTATTTTSPPSFNAEQPTLSVWSSPTTLPTIQTYTGGASTIASGMTLITGLAIGLIIFLYLDLI